MRAVTRRNRRNCGIQVERVEKRDKRDVDGSGKFMVELFLLFTAFIIAFVLQVIEVLNTAKIKCIVGIFIKKKCRLKNIIIYGFYYLYIPR